MKVKERDGAGQVHEQQNLKASTLRNSPAFKVYRFLACVSAPAFKVYRFLACVRVRATSFSLLKKYISVKTASLMTDPISQNRLGHGVAALLDHLFLLPPPGAFPFRKAWSVVLSGYS